MVISRSIRARMLSHSVVSDSVQPYDVSVHGILQTRVLEQVAMPSSRGIFLTQGSNPHLLFTCTSRQVLYHQCPLGPSMLLQVALFFFVVEYYSVCVYMCLHTHTHTHILIHSSVDRHLGCFHVLAIVNSAFTNIGMHVSFQIKSSI